jgi:small-conductance mechanosensitive channel
MIHRWPVMFADLDPRAWTIAWGDVAVAAASVALAVIVALIVHRLIFAALLRIARRTTTPADTVVFEALYSPVRWSMVAVAIAVVARTEPLVGTVWRVLGPFLGPALLGWIAFALVRTLAMVFDLRSVTAHDPVAARSHRTRIAILSRTATFIIVFVTVALMLFQLPGVREVGVTLLASAGLAALAVGAAAQPALKSLIAGLQMAITEPVRIGDLVAIDGHTGRVEEIRMSFVVVRMWDERAAIVPTIRFLDESFENWSRESEMLSGPVFLHLDPATEVEPIRREFLRFIATQEKWDRRTATLLMTEAHPESIELRMAMSAATIGDLFDLRCAVREHMIGWLRREMADSLIRHRLGVETANARAATP